MAEGWELRELRRELDRLERRVDKLEERDRQRSERLNWWFAHIVWTLYIAALTAYVLLA